jgi:hypothetical protein
VREWSSRVIKNFLGLRWKANRSGELASMADLIPKTVAYEKRQRG